MKTRILQYKLLSNVLFLNSRPYHMRVVSSPARSFCQEFRETPEHLFVNRRYAKELWQRVWPWCTPSLQLSDLTGKSVLVVELPQAFNIQLINHIIVILFKKFLCENHQNGGKINMISF